MPEKTIDLSQTVYEICTRYPEVAEIMAELGFKDITRPGMLNTAGRFMTLPKGALLKKLDLAVIRSALEARGFTVVG